MIKVVISEPCRECNGRGRPGHTPTMKCRYCNGTGRKQREVPLAEFAALLDSARTATTTKETKMSGFKQYRRKQIAELRAYEAGDDITNVSVSSEDAKAGSPKQGDMIARNPKNHADQWLVSAAYFADNFEAAN